MKKLMKMTLSILLTAVFLVQMIPVQAVSIDIRDDERAALETRLMESDKMAETQLLEEGEAADADSQNELDEPAAIIEEVESLREENAKHYRNKGGSYTVAMYEEPVHFQDQNGIWQEIDNSLILNRRKLDASGRASYTPAASGLDIRIPQDFAQGDQLTVAKDGYTVSLGVSASNEDAVLSQAAAIVEVEDLASENLTPEMTKERSMRSEEITAGPRTRLQKIEENNAEITELDNLTSAAVYSAIFSGADLEYVISPNKIKENIVVKAAQAEYIYQFDFSFDGLFPVQQEDGSIYLLKNTSDEKPLFILEAPYMYDAAEEYSTAIDMTLEGNTLTLTADAEWINDEARVWPVVIDPTLKVPNNSIDSYYVQTDPTCWPLTNTVIKNPSGYHYAGLGTNGGIHRTYLKFDLPTLPVGSVVNQATIEITQNDTQGFQAGMQLYAFQCPASWSFNGKRDEWNEQPVSATANGLQKSAQLDYVKIESGSLLWFDKGYQFDLTRAVRDWIDGTAANHGIIFATGDETKTTRVDMHSPRQLPWDRPVVRILYTNNLGLESDWSYETVDLGRSGTASINLYNKELTYVHNTVGTGGNRLPINISHVFNSSGYAAYSSNPYGANFHLNVEEWVQPNTVSNENVTYEMRDADGTIHYFSKYGNKIVNEKDPGQVLEVVSSSVYKITDAQGNIKQYELKPGDTARRWLTKITDKNGDEQSITQTNTRQITNITDPVQRTATFTYSGGMLQKITDPALRQTNFTYDPSGKLTQITYPDGKTTGFVYAANGQLTRINAFDGSAVAFTYSSSKLTKLTRYEKNGTTVAATLTFTFSKGMTRVTDSHGRYNEYVFNHWGQAVNVGNHQGQRSFAMYSNVFPDNDTDDLSAAKVSMVSATQVAVKNVLWDSSFERNVSWVSINSGSPTGSRGITNAQAYRGLNSYFLTNSSGTGILGSRHSKDIPVEPGQTYTFSVHALVPVPLTETGTVRLGYSYTNSAGTLTWNISNTIPANDVWQRFSYTFTVPSGITAIRPVVAVANGAGTAYFDAVQLELCEGTNQYNHVDDRNFTETTGQTPAWATSSFATGDGVVAVTDGNAIKMTGSAALQKKITQSIQLNAKSGETIIIGGMAKATNASAEHWEESRNFAVTADVYTANGTKIGNTIYAHFNRDISGYAQMAAASLKLDQSAARIDYSFVYNNQIGSVEFSEPFVYIGDFSTTYTYNSDDDGKGFGLVTNVKSDNGKETVITYNTNNDMTKVEEKQNGKAVDTVNIEYDDRRRVTSTTDSNKTTTSYTYLGNTHFPTKITTQNGQLSTSESMTYHQSGNYLATQTDARGKTSSYTYDSSFKKGLLMSETDPNGNVTSYTYDNNTDQQLSVSGQANTTVKTEFAYQDDIMQAITRNNGSSPDYAYTFDTRNRLTQAKVGTANLVTNTYDTRDRLTKQTFANGAYYEPAYNDLDQLTGESWNGTQIAAYNYNSLGQLSKETDKITNVSRQYNYDLADRLHTVTGTDGTNTSITYDSKNTPNRLTYSRDGATISDVGYSTDAQGKPTKAMYYTLGSMPETYTYDALNRLTKKSVGVNSFFDTTITYLAGTSSQTTGLVGTIKSERVSGGAATLMQQYTYTYDNNGNIKTVKDKDNATTTYTYDGLNRLASEKIGSDTFAYAYDAGGNITSAKKNGAAQDTYTYSTGNWKDQLTSFNGQAITYDTMGNPLTYGGQTFTWTKGRQLASVTGPGNLKATYQYNAKGQRISKTVSGSTVSEVNGTTTYDYAGGLLMEMTPPNGNTFTFVYDANGEARGYKTDNGTRYYYQRNAQGDIVAVTASSTATPAAEYTYDAWGRPLTATGSSVRNPLRYRGYVYDEETGFYYCNTRYYNPQWRRWLNADRHFIAGDQLNAANMYAYCNGNPVMLIDPTGMAAYYHPLGWWPYIPWWLTIFAAPFNAYGGFGASRPNGRKHAGIDFVVLWSTPVYAIADGVALYYIEGFTKDKNGNKTDALVVQHADGTVVLYGEITVDKELKKNLDAGKRPSVKRGQRIGKTKRWKNGNMLHLEIYEGTVTGYVLGGNNKYNRRSDLLDPTALKFYRW